MKTPFITKAKAEEIIKEIPTPFHIYDEEGIRENARKLYKAFSWNKGFKEYFAVKATPNPTILKILKEEGCGTDCSSLTELMMSDKMGFKGDEIMFSSNDTPAEEFVLAKKLNATINLDDFTHIDFLEKSAGIPEKICCRFNPGGKFSISTTIMDNPGDAKYGMTKDQIIEAYKILKAKGVKRFGMHAFLASNTVTNEYYPTLAKILFETAVEIKEKTGVKLDFINLSGGVGIPYTPDKEPNDIMVIGEGVRKVYEEVLVHGKTSICKQSTSIISIQFVLSSTRHGDVAFFSPRTTAFYILATILFCIFLYTSAIQIFQFKDILQFGFINTVRIINITVTIRHGDNFSSETDQFFYCILSYISRSRYRNDFTFNIDIPGFQHFKEEIYITITGSLRTNQRTSEFKSFTGKSPCIFTSQFFIHTIHITDLTSSNSDITGRNISFRSDMTPQFSNKSLTKTHDFRIGFSFRVKVRTSFTTPHRQCCQRVFKSLFERKEFKDR